MRGRGRGKRGRSRHSDFKNSNYTQLTFQNQREQDIPSNSWLRRAFSKTLSFGRIDRAFVLTGRGGGGESAPQF